VRNDSLAAAPKKSTAPVIYPHLKQRHIGVDHNSTGKLMTNMQPASAGTKTLVDNVIARFNGNDVAFKIHRDDLPVFEARFGSAYHLYRRIAAGHWTVADIRNVLRFASAARPKPGTVAQYAMADPALLAAMENARAPSTMRSQPVARPPMRHWLRLCSVPRLWA